MKTIFSRATETELRQLLDAGAPATAILKEVARLLGPEAMGAASLKVFTHGGQPQLTADELSELGDLIAQGGKGLLTPAGEARYRFLSDKREAAREGLSRYRHARQSGGAA